MCLCCCSSAVTLSLRHCMSLISRPSVGCCVCFAGGTWGLLSGCLFPALYVGRGPLAKVRWKCYADGMGGQSANASLFVHMSVLVWTERFLAFSLHWLQSLARLFHSLGCPGILQKTALLSGGKCDSTSLGRSLSGLWLVCSPSLTRDSFQRANPMHF